MEIWQFAIVFGLIAYLGVCFGALAKRNGLNPWLWGAISVVSPINLLVLGYWALRRREKNATEAGAGRFEKPAPDARAAPPEAHESLIRRKTVTEVPLTGPTSQPGLQSPTSP